MVVPEKSIPFSPSPQCRFQTRASPGIARVKFWSIVVIALRKLGCDIMALLRVSPARVTWQL